MKRIALGERSNLKAEAEYVEFNILEMYGERYWDERNAYRFTLNQIENDLEDPTTELIRMCYDAAQRIVKSPTLMSKLAIPEQYHNAIFASWEKGEKDIYGRFDLAYDGKSSAKMLEFNADTPTSLYESAVFQWRWMEQMRAERKISKNADQFNSIHEKLIEAFRIVAGPSKEFHFACFRDSEEDRITADYMADCAHQAGITITSIDIRDLGIDADNWFVDMNDNRITNLFKLYPLEFMMKEQYGSKLPVTPTKVYEPLWKAVLSNKGLLPVLWEMFPESPNLLPAYFADDPRAKELTNFIKKPLLSREGENVELVSSEVPNGKVTTEGDYGEEGYIYQQAHVLPMFGDDYTLIGSWVVAGEACGICIREDKSPITQNLSRFVPHYIEG
jgi:glutathionylspermidine synthase